jgi:hypothetical protein
MINHTVLSLRHQRNCPYAQERIIICIDPNGMFCSVYAISGFAMPSWMLCLHYCACPTCKFTSREFHCFHYCFCPTWQDGVANTQKGILLVLLVTSLSRSRNMLSLKYIHDWALIHGLCMNVLPIINFLLYSIGCQHKKKVLFCSCEDDAVTLVKLQLWPGSATRPLVAFHFKLMMLAEVLLLECHVSLKKFCDTLGLNKSNMLPLLVCTQSPYILSHCW